MPPPSANNPREEFLFGTQAAAEDEGNSAAPLRSRSDPPPSPLPQRRESPPPLGGQLDRDNEYA